MALRAASSQVRKRPADGASVRRFELDDDTADYWARQIRIGTIIAAVVTSIGALRIGLSWPASQRWWAAPVLVAVLLQIVALRLPWNRLVRSEKIHRRLLWWGLAELP